MLVDLLAAASMLVGGAFLLWSLGAKGWGVAPWGLAVGAFLTVGVGFLQAATPLPGSPILTMVVVVVAPVALWMIARRRGGATRVPPLLSLAAMASTAVTVAVHHLVHTFTFHVDSMEYLGVGALQVTDRYSLAVIPDQIDKRFMAVSTLHAPAHLAGEYFLAGVTPLMATATVAIVAWLVFTQARGTLGRGGAIVIAALGVAGLATMNRFDFHAVYLNGHLFFGMGLLAVAGASWLLVTGSNALGRAPVVVAALGSLFLVLTRAEGTFLALAAIIPAIAAPLVARRTRTVLLGSLGASTTAWYGFATAIKAARGYPLGTSGVMVVAGVALCVAAAVVATGRTASFERKLPAVYEMGLLGVLVGMTCVNPGILRTSVRALYFNAFGWLSSWGFSLTMLLILMPLSLCAARGARLSALRMPLTMFFPIAMLLAYGRGSPYRIASADSLNRMLIEVVPLTVAFVLMAATSTRGDRLVAAPV